MPSSDDYFDDDLALDAASFDAIVATALTKPSTTSASTTSRLPSNLQQRTLHGGPISGPSKPPTNVRSKVVDVGSQAKVLDPASQQPRIASKKKWDRVKMAQSLPRMVGAKGKGKGAKGKGKGKASSWGQYDDDEDEEVLDDDSDADLLRDAALEDALGPLPPMKLQCDESEIGKWVYSVNKPKRKYQYDIVHRALYNNCLVSLPTGLGKTFIAAVVMLNFYRWYPKGKILFLAPTKPLVFQQIEACHSIAGIPSVDCVALTGSIPAARRTLAWTTKRVIFSTPQTVENDLRRGRLDPQDVVCVVVDEAHRATGGYAYCEVVRVLMRFNPWFRVLALTATPGNDAEKVQNVIDGLHIGHIEVRTEESMDITPYTKVKSIHLEIIPLSPTLLSIRDRWASLMQPHLNKLDPFIYGPKSPSLISPFALQQIQSRLPPDRQYLRATVALAHRMATAMGRLLEYSITAGMEKMRDLKGEKGKTTQSVCESAEYKSLMGDLERMRLEPGFSNHPKMDRMKAVILDYFVTAKDEGKTPRLMVFCHFRDVVEDIVSFLNMEKPMIHASAFVGQGKDSKGKQGMNQKAQAEVIRKFKENEFNVLVATSIGEEGLDIGALDCIVCYDAQTSPLRTLQRIGRTGRNDDGKVIVLMAEGREEHNYSKATDKYEHVQSALSSRNMFSLFEDCERLVPPGIKPVVEERVIPVQPYIAEQVEITEAAKEAKRAAKGKTKKVRDGAEDIPPGGMRGFITAREVRVPKSKEESLADRAEAALLDEDQVAELARHWQKGVSLALAEPAVDLATAEVVSKSTTTPVGRPQHGSKLAPSQRFEETLTRGTWDDDESYDAWKEACSTALEHKWMNWFPEECKGKGARRPVRLCGDTKSKVRARFVVVPPAKSTAEQALEGELFGDEEEMGGSGSRSRSRGERVATRSPPPIRIFKSPVRSPRPAAGDFKPLAGPSKPTTAAPRSPIRNALFLKTSSPLFPPSPPGEPFPPFPSAQPFKAPRPSDPDNVLSSDEDADSPFPIRRGSFDAGLGVDSDEEMLPSPPFKFAVPAAVESGERGSEGGDSTFGDEGFFEDLSEGAFAEMDALAAAACANPPAKKAVDVDADMDVDVDVDDGTVFKKPWRKMSSSSLKGEAEIDESTLPVVGRRKGKGKAPRIRDSFEGVGAATQMPFIRGIGKKVVGNGKAKGKEKEEIWVEDSENEDEDRGQKRRVKKLRRAGEVDEDGEDEAGGEEGGRKRKKEKVASGEKKEKRKRGIGGLLPLDSSESSDSGSSTNSKSKRKKRKKSKTKKPTRSSSPSIASEDSSDRAFVVHSSQSPSKSMGNFYRDSLLTQHPVNNAFQSRPRKHGELKFASAGRGRRTWMDTPDSKRGEREDDEWSVGSFVVGDEDVEFEEGAEGEDGGTSEL